MAATTWREYKIMDYIPIAIPSMDEREYEALKEPLLSGWLTQGPLVKKFEQEFAETHNVKYALATTSCTTALHLMLVAAGIGSGDEVIVPSFTWIATANAVIYVGATPVLADIDLDSFNISTEDILRKITNKTKAVIVVHLFGNPFDVDSLKSQLPSSIQIFEDAACAAGASVNGKKAGNLGRAAAFSFHPRKSITTGEGGMLTTNDEDIYKLAEKYRNHGAKLSEEQRHLGTKPYLLPDFDVIGFNYRMTDIQAAIGRVQLSKLQKFINERDMIASIYNAELTDIEWLVTPKKETGVVHAWQAYVLRIKRENSKEFRDKLMDYLHKKSIATRPGTHAIHMLNAYNKGDIELGRALSNSRIAAETTLAIPLHNKLKQEQIIYITDTIRNFT